MQPDKTKSHFFGEHPNKSKSPYPAFRARFVTLVKPLAKRHVEIVNCTRRTVLSAFPLGKLEDVLASKAVAA